MVYPLLSLSVGLLVGQSPRLSGINVRMGLHDLKATAMDGTELELSKFAGTPVVAVRYRRSWDGFKCIPPVYVYSVARAQSLGIPYRYSKRPDFDPSFEQLNVASK